jgi:hypothetical protein
MAVRVGSSNIGPQQRLDLAHEMPIVLDHEFLNNLGIAACDSRCEWDTASGQQVLIHPSSKGF